MPTVSLAATVAAALCCLRGPPKGPPRWPGLQTDRHRQSIVASESSTQLYTAHTQTSRLKSFRSLLCSFLTWPGRSCYVCDLWFDLVLGMNKTTFTAQGKEHGLLPDGTGGPMGTSATHVPDSRSKDSEKSADTSRDYKLHLVRKYPCELTALFLSCLFFSLPINSIIRFFIL